MSRVLRGHLRLGSLLAQGEKPAPDQVPGLPGVFSLFVPWIRRGFQASEEVQRVDSHVPGEEHIELAEPEKLTAVAGHGSLEESKTSYRTLSLTVSVSSVLSSSQ